MAACPVPNPFDFQHLNGVADQAAERIRKGVEIWCRGERMRMDGDYGAAIQVFREARALGLIAVDAQNAGESMLQHPRVVASGLSGELLLAIRDAIGRARQERGRGLGDDAES